MTPVRELIDRLEGVAGPDRKLDVLLFAHLECDPSNTDADIMAAIQSGQALDAISQLHWDWQWSDFPSRYTASVDAALALIERVLPGVWWLLGRGKCTAAEPEFGAQLMFGEEPISVAEASTPALALVKALLRALDVQDGAVDGSSLHSTRGKG